MHGIAKTAGLHNLHLAQQMDILSEVSFGKERERESEREKEMSIDLCKLCNMCEKGYHYEAYMHELCSYPC